MLEGARLPIASPHPTPASVHGASGVGSVFRSFRSAPGEPGGICFRKVGAYQVGGLSIFCVL